MNKTDPLKPSGLNSDFQANKYKSFSDYVEQIREIIEKARVDITENNRETIIDANSPYEWLPTNPTSKNPNTHKFKRGILLIHGLFDSPLIMDSLAKLFIQQNYLVRNLLLPGHGTVPGDLLNVSHKAWQDALSFACQSFVEEVDELYICGFSTGGVLGILESLQNSFIKGLILIAPAIQLKKTFALISNFNHLLSRTIGGITWYSRNEATDYAKYQSATFNSAQQVFLLTQLLMNTLKKNKLSIPIFMVVTQDDEVLSIDAGIKFFNELENSHKQLILYSNKKPLIENNHILWFNSTVPQQSILNFSHVCLPVASDHPHYGINGDFSEQQDIRLFYEKYLPNKVKNDAVVYGAISHENLRQYRLRRLRYNPDFTNMATQILQFMQAI